MGAAKSSQSRGAFKQGREMAAQRGVDYNRGDDVADFPKRKNSNQTSKKRKAGEEVKETGGVKKVKLEVSSATKATMPSGNKKRKAADESDGDVAVKKIKLSDSSRRIAGEKAADEGMSAGGASPGIAEHENPNVAKEDQAAATDDDAIKSVAAAENDISTIDGPVKKKRTGFLDLPAELRNDIYALALATGRPTHIVPNASWSHEPGLLSSHPQIRHEALPMYRKHAVYRTNSVKRALHFVKIQLPQDEYKHLERLEITCRDKEERSLRAVRRALHTFKHAFGRKGLRTAVVKVQMPVFEYNNRDKYEMVWADIDNLKEFIFREGYWYKHTVRLSDVPPSNLHGNGRNTCR